MRKSSIVVVIVALAVALSACGGGSDKSASKTKTKAGPKAPVSLSGTVNNKGTKDLGSNTKLEVEQDDFYFSPTFIKATPGATLTVELKNEGENAHTFTIDALNISETVDPGKSKTVTVEVPADGATLNFYCEFHKGSGMQGAIYTSQGAAGQPAAAVTSSSATSSSESAPTTTSGYGY